MAGKRARSGSDSDLSAVLEKGQPGHTGSLAAKPKRTSNPRWQRPAEIQELIGRLEGLYGVSRLRARFDPMEELVSCILSQHSSDRSSFPAFTHLRETFPDWQAVAEAGQERLVETIKAAGLPNQKAKSILGCLTAIRERTGSYSLEVLRTMPTLEARKWLLDLPGVGPKTASIVLCFSFGRETIPVDTHVYRVSSRLGLLPEGISEAKAHDALLALVPKGLAYRFHAALIQHGRNICMAPIPNCGECPLTEGCAWFQEERPSPKKPKKSEAKENL